MIIKYIFLLIFTVNGRELREESAVEDALLGLLRLVGEY